MNLKEALRLQKRNKYGNKRAESNGLVFDSKLEAACYEQLVLLERAGEIQDLQRQVPIPITVNGRDVCKLVIDFQFWDKRNCCLVWRDAKGLVTAFASLKLKLARALYPDVRVEIWKGDA